MTNSHQLMLKELRRLVLPELRKAGFTGTFPHLRRRQNEWVDLLTFQFDIHGGGLVVEINRCPAFGGTTAWGTHIPPEKVKAWDFNPRKRIQARPGSGTAEWFRFDIQSPTDAANELVRALSAADLWESVPFVGLPGTPSES